MLLWLADRMHADFARRLGVARENTRGDTVPFAFLWRSRRPAPKEFPGVPTLARLEVMQWGVLRPWRYGAAIGAKV